MEEELVVEFQYDYMLITGKTPEELQSKVKSQLAKKDNDFESDGSPTYGDGVWVQAMKAMDEEEVK